MSRKCAVTGKGVMSGHSVSHANNKTKRRFKPNLQVTSVFSESLGRMIRIRVSTNGLRTIEHKGGLDAYLLATADSGLETEMRRLKRQVSGVLASRAAA